MRPFRDYFGTILYDLTFFINKKHENHIKSVCFRFVLPRGSLAYLAGDGEGGRGTIYIREETVECMYLLASIFDISVVR